VTGNVCVWDGEFWVTCSGIPREYNKGDLDFDRNVYLSDRTQWVTNSGVTNPILK